MTADPHPARAVDWARQIADNGITVAAVRHPHDDAPGWSASVELAVPATAVDDRGVAALSVQEASALALLLARAVSRAEQHTGAAR